MLSRLALELSYALTIRSITTTHPKTLTLLITCLRMNLAFKALASVVRDLGGLLANNVHLVTSDW
jgi:hypothetical protein